MATMIHSRTAIGSVVRVALAALLWGALTAVLLVYVPQQKRRLDDFGLQPPAVTQAVFNTGVWFADWWWVFVPALLALLLVAAYVTQLIRSRGDNRLLAAFWTFLLLAPPLLGHVFVWGGLLLAWMKLSEGLSR